MTTPNLRTTGDNNTIHEWYDISLTPIQDPRIIPLYLRDRSGFAMDLIDGPGANIIRPPKEHRCCSLKYFLISLVLTTLICTTFAVTAFIIIWVVNKSPPDATAMFRGNLTQSSDTVFPSHTTNDERYRYHGTTSNDELDLVKLKLPVKKETTRQVTTFHPLTTASLSLLDWISNKFSNVTSMLNSTEKQTENPNVENNFTDIISGVNSSKFHLETFPNETVSKELSNSASNSSEVVSISNFVTTEMSNTTDLAEKRMDSGKVRFNTKRKNRYKPTLIDDKLFNKLQTKSFQNKSTSLQQNTVLLKHSTFPSHEVPSTSSLPTQKNATDNGEVTETVISTVTNNNITNSNKKFVKQATTSQADFVTKKKSNEVIDAKPKLKLVSFDNAF